MNIINRIKQNSIFIIILLGLIVAFVLKDNEQTTNLVISADDQISLHLNEDTVLLEQTWMPMEKILTNVSIPYMAKNDAEAVLDLLIYNDNYSEIIGTVQINQTFIAGEEGVLFFDLGKIPAVAGGRYRFQIWCESCECFDKEGKIFFPVGTNYGGLTIEGQEQNAALDMSVSHLKYSFIFWFVASLFPFLSGTLLLMISLKKKLEEVVAVPLLLEGLILYLFGITNHLIVGLNFVYVLALTSFVVSIVLFNKKPEEERNLSTLCSPGMWIFLVFLLIIIIADKGDWLGNRDELRHWGIAVRDMFYYDAFVNHYNCNIILYRYVPFTAIIEYAFEFMNGYFSEDILFMAFHILLLSTLMPLTEPIYKNKKLLVPGMVGMICLPIIFCNYVSSTIMPDVYLGALMGYGLILVYKRERDWFGILRIFLVLCVLPLVKDMGFVIGGLLAVVWLLDEFYSFLRDKAHSIKKCVLPIIGGVLVLLAYLTWQNYLKTPIQDYRLPKTLEGAEEACANTDEYNILETIAGLQDDCSKVATLIKNNSWVESDGNANISSTMNASGIDLKVVLQIFMGHGDERQNQITKSFIKELFDGESYTLGSVKISCMDAWALMICFVIVLGMIGFWCDEKRRITALIIFLTLAFGVYAFVILMTYWFTFSFHEGLDLTSFGRYMVGFILGTSLWILYLIMKRVSESENEIAIKKQGSIILVLIVGALFILTPCEQMIVEPRDYNGNVSEDMVYGYEDILNILQTVAGRDDKAFFVCSESSGWSSYLFRNRVNPISSDYENWNIVANEEDAVSEDIHSIPVVLSEEQLNNRLSECQYMVIFHCNDTFRRDYEMFFDNPEDIQDGSVFRVDYGENTKCYLIGRTGIKAYH